MEPEQARRRLRNTLAGIAGRGDQPQIALAGGEPCTKFYDGLPVTGNFHEETVDHFRGVEMMADDVMLVTFPKCGTTWCWKILHSLLRMDKSGGLPAEGKFNKEEDYQQVRGKFATSVATSR